MRSPSSSPMNRRRLRGRRGFNVIEILVAGFLTTIVTVALAFLLSTGARMQQTVSLQTDADQRSVLAMNRMIVEVREATDVTIVSESRFRVFFPYVMSNGHYDRYQVNTNDYVEYYQARADGSASSAGGYIYRKTKNGNPERVAEDVRQLRISTNTPRSIRLTVELEKKSGEFSKSTRLTERVLYLRNS